MSAGGLASFSVEELRNIYNALREWADLAEVPPEDAYQAIERELLKRTLKVMPGG